MAHTRIGIADSDVRHSLLKIRAAELCESGWSRYRFGLRSLITCDETQPVPECLFVIREGVKMKV
jgi:hypothetical protein